MPKLPFTYRPDPSREKVLTLVERRASDGLTRVVLRTSGGGVVWRPEAT